MKDIYDRTMELSEIIKKDLFSSEHTNELMLALIADIGAQHTPTQEDKRHAVLIYAGRYVGDLKEKISWLASDLFYYSDRWCGWRVEVVKLAWEDIRKELLIVKLAGVK